MPPGYATREIGGLRRRRRVMIIARLQITFRCDDIREDAIEFRLRHPPSRIRGDDFNDGVYASGSMMSA